MYMFDLNWQYNWRYNRSIVLPIHIKHVHFSVSYQWAIYQKYDRRGSESPNGYGVLPSNPIFHQVIFGCVGADNAIHIALGAF